MNTAILGVDERMDDQGRRHPWRIAVIGRELRHIVVTALPRGVVFIQNPRHPVHGDLTRIERCVADGVVQLIERLADAGVGRVEMAEMQRGATVARMLELNGIEIRYHEVEYQGDLREDPFSIGGDAGHEIAIVERNARSAE